MLLQAFYPVRSERQLMERIEFDLLLVGLSASASMIQCGTTRAFPKTATDYWREILPPNFSPPYCRDRGSGGCCRVTLIEAWASMKRLKPRDPPADTGPRGGGRNAPADIRGEKRSNATHRSTTDPDARLYRKGRGMEARLCYIGHGLIENRSGLIVDGRLTRVSGHAERLAALDMMEPWAHRSRAITLGADKGYDAAHFVEELRTIILRPHVAQNESAPLGDRQTDDTASQLCRQPAHPQTDRGSLRLNQDRCRTAPDQAARVG